MAVRCLWGRRGHIYFSVRCARRSGSWVRRPLRKERGGKNKEPDYPGPGGHGLLARQMLRVAFVFLADELDQFRIRQDALINLDRPRVGGRLWVVAGGRREGG